MFSLLFLIATLTKFAPETEAIFLPYWSKRNHSETSFHIPFSTLALDNSPRRSKKLQDYFDLATNYSLDYRCATGLPISIAWHVYSPYTTVYQTKNKGSTGLTVDGMFPAILKAALSGCCNKNSDVLFGKLSKSVRSVENDIEKDRFDLTFPIYGYDNSDIFR